MAYTDKFDRSDADNRTAREIPEVVVSGIIEDAKASSAVLQVADVHVMRAFQERYRLTNSFPEAYWIKGTTDVAGGAGGGTQAEKDSAFKQTTSMTWDNKYLTPEELAVLAAMPDNWRQDSDITWDEIRGHIRSAANKAIDRAVLFGDATGGLPASFGPGLVAEALADGTDSFVVVGEGVDRADDYALVGQALADKGYDLNGFLTRNAEMWALRRLRDGESRPLLEPLTSGKGVSLYGASLTEVSNGAWDATEAVALAGDWKMLKVGIRKDMTFDMSNSAPIFNTSGELIYNPFQQDGEVMRFCLRIGYEILDPIRNLSGDRAFPFVALLPSGYSS